MQKVKTTKKVSFQEQQHQPQSEVIAPPEHIDQTHMTTHEKKTVEDLMRKLTSLVFPH